MNFTYDVHMNLLENFLGKKIFYNNNQNIFSKIVSEINKPTNTS